jgi:hypothetical protein
MASAEEIAWAAGLFEGEGCISYIRPWGREPDIQAALAMTDEDVVRRFDEIVDRGRVYGPYHPPFHRPAEEAFLAMGRTGTRRTTSSTCSGRGSRVGVARKPERKELRFRRHSTVTTGISPWKRRDRRKRADSTWPNSGYSGAPCVRVRLQRLL